MLAAFFAGMEIAFLASNKLRLELERKQGLLSSRIIGIFQEYSGQYIATIQLGNNIAIVIYGIFISRWLDSFFSSFITDTLAEQWARSVHSVQRPTPRQPQPSSVQ